ncbi:two-component regulator propeller domain-containing protein [Pelagibius sp. Alg239-R121]|uniref:two-component regulator propeller domain-containing protein n=1 Tax=Pelagibius sp. Alg239-R121 TaxID=2993448 RepID=UPI0024A7887D|nr:two-component regulator propeller domain-containing protein [Pelagibius sp. Alg239-R121]
MRAVIKYFEEGSLILKDGPSKPSSLRLNCGIENRVIEIGRRGIGQIHRKSKTAGIAGRLELFFDALGGLGEKIRKEGSDLGLKKSNGHRGAIDEGLRCRALVFACLITFLANLSIQRAEAAESPEWVLDTGAVTAGGFEDSDGILWFATANGALRYDYRDAKYFGSDGSVFLSRVGSIAEDRDGRIWFARSAGGIVIYDKDRNSFISHRHDPADPNSLSSDTMNWAPGLIATRSDGSVWVGTGNGLNVLDEAGSGFRHYFHDPTDPNSLSGNNIWGLHVDSKDRLWVATSSGLSRLDPGADNFVNYHHDPSDPASLAANQVYSVAEGRNGEIWLGTENGLGRLDPSGDRFTNFRHDPGEPNGISNSQVLSVTVDSQGRVWLGRIFAVAAGVEMYDPEIGSFEVVLRSPGAMSPDTTEMILSVFEGADGTIWLPYNTGPVYRILPTPSIWTARFDDPGPPERHLEPVLVVNEDSNGGIWVGGVGGLKRYDPQTRSYARWLPETDLTGNLEPPLKLEEVNTILQAGDNRLWIGEVDSDFLLVDTASRSILKRWNSQQLAFGTWGGVYDPGNPEIIWFGSQTSGLGRVDIRDGSYKFFNSSSNVDAGVKASFVSQVTVTNTGEFWLSTWGQGLLKFDGKKVIGAYNHDPNDPATIGSSNVSEVEYGPQGRLWIATVEGGLNVFDEAAGKFERIGPESGLTTNTIFAIESDAEGYLWLATNAGVFQFEPESRRVVARYGREDALPSDVLLSWPGGTLMTSGQDLMFGTLSGLGVISLPSLKTFGEPPRVVFTSLTQGGSKLPLQSAVERAEKFELHWPDTDFEFQASVIGSAGHTHREIRYRLEGYDKDWIVADSESQVTYRRVPGGTYSLLTQGRAGHGPWSDSAILAVTVYPPFWQMLWFQSGAVILILGSILGFVSWRLNLARRLVTSAQALKDSEERLRLLTDAVPILFAYVDKNYRYQFNNKAFEDWFSHGREDLRGLHVKEVLGGSAFEVLREYIDRALAGSTVIFESAVPFKDGGERFIRATYAPDFDQFGSVPGFYLVVEDITDSKAAEERLRQAQKMEAVGQLTGGVAHDFNNLLAIILGLAEQMQSNASYNEKMVETIIRTSGRGAELTHRLLAFSRQQPLATRTLDLAALVEGMSDLLTRTLGETIAIKFQTDAGLWPAAADPAQVENALLNLAVNARDAMPGGGKITIECRNTHLDDAYVAENAEAEAGEYVMLAVTDSGTGMDATVQAHAFEPFFTTKDVGQGSGLGLSMVYGFAKQSGGHVSLYSEAGQGTTVKLYLPRDQAVEAKAVEDETAEIPRGRGEEVLVIEDDPEVRELVTRTLDGLGYRVTGVPEATAARAALESGQEFDLLLSDVVLPGGTSGPEFAEEVSARFPSLKVIFMSGYPADAAKRNGVLGSGDVLLNKPFRRHQLAKALRKTLD